MYRIGMFTGNVYSQEDYDKDKIRECCICMSPSLKYDEAYRQAKEYQEAKNITECMKCYGCEEAKRIKL